MLEIGKSQYLAYRITRRVLALVLLLIAALVLAGVLVNYELNRVALLIDEKYIEHGKTDALQEKFHGVVGDVRGYLAYGNPDFLKELEVKRLTFRTDIAAFAGAGTGGTALLYPAAEISVLWEQYDGLIDDAIAYKAAGDMDGLRQLSVERATPIIQEIDANFKELVSNAESELSALLAYNNTVSKRLNVGIMAFVCLMFVIITIMLNGFFRRSVVQPLTVLSDAVERLGRGEYPKLPDPQRRDEFGKLYSGYNLMIQELEQRQEELKRTNFQLAEQRDELEAQNEEIIAQQDEQNRTLQLLMDRERDLERISLYQERLTGFTDMNAFLAASVSALLKALRLDAAIVVHRRTEHSPPCMLYSAGYPSSIPAELSGPLFGPADLVFRADTMITIERVLSAGERGVHQGYEMAVDYYCPLHDDNVQAIGFLLLTGYGRAAFTEVEAKVAAGLIKQFSTAFYTQLLNEERRAQAAEMEVLNAELEKEQRRLKDQRDFVQSIVESIHEGLVLCVNDVVRFVNPVMEQLFGLDSLEGSPFGALCDRLSEGSEETFAAAMRLFRQLADGERSEASTRFSFRKSPETPVGHFELYAGILPSVAHQRGMLLVFRDRTEEEKADEAKNEFVGIVSHELRTPLSSIMGFMEILLHREVPKERQKKYLETVYKESQRLSHLISDFLDLQRMESGKQTYHFIPIDVNGWIRETADNWKGNWPHRIVLEHAPGISYVTGDPDRLTQVMYNLLSNAMKYSPGSDRVHIRIQTEGQHCYLKVTDYGLGIPEEAKPMLFTKFFRVDNSDRRQIGGTGLGLSIVKEIVEAHGGELTFQSEIGKGSTFQVKLPLYHIPDVAGKVILIEDDANMSGLIGIAIERLQLGILTFRTSEAATLAMSRASGRPAICIVDIQLAGHRTGLDFLDAMKTYPMMQGTPIIVATVLESPEGFYETETQRFLRKPFTVDNLMQVVQELLKTGGRV